MESTERRIQEAVEAEEETRNWAELPGDVLSVIFKKIGAIEILMRAQWVCRPWRHLSLEPGVWRIIDMTSLHGDNGGLDLEAMAREAVDRSQGHLQEFSLEYFGSDHLLPYIADRTSDLRCLRLISTYGIKEEGLAESLSRFPLLEEIDITFGSYSEQACKSIGQACPNLKYFHLNSVGSRHDRFESDEEAISIANHMPDLRRLQLMGNNLTNEGLTTILDKCQHLQTLDLRRCFNVNFNASLRAKCANIVDLKLPDDYIDEYEFHYEFEDGEGSYGSFDDDCYHSELDMMIHDNYNYDDGDIDDGDISENDFDEYFLH